MGTDPASRWAGRPRTARAATETPPTENQGQTAVGGQRMSKILRLSNSIFC